MSDKKRDKYLRIIFWLGIIGLLTSFYLVKNHYSAESALCDFGETVSCSAVNTSIYSEFLSIPVAFLGALWFLVMLYLVNLIKKSHGSKLEDLTNFLLLCNVAGIISVIYFIWAEYVLKAICPFCTVIHLITLITLVLSYRLYKDQGKKIKLLELIKSMRNLLLDLIITLLILLAYFNLGDNGKNYDQLAKCLSEKEVSMYGSFTCGHCLQQKKDFGDSFKYIDYVECHPQGKNNKYDLCFEEVKIEGTPTWVMEKDGEETKRLSGYKEPEVLADFFGCELNIESSIE